MSDVKEEGITRREFFRRAGLASVIAGLSAATGHAQEKPITLSEFSRRPEFEGALIMGKTNNISAAELERKIRGKFVTVTFGFEGCTTYCPIVNTSLDALNKKVGRDKIVNIVINLGLATSDKTDKPNSGFVPKSEGKDLDGDVVTITYNPSTVEKLAPDGTAAGDKFKLGLEEYTKRLQIAVGQIASNPTIPKGQKGPAHTSYITLFGKEGTRIGDADGLSTEKAVKTLDKLIDAYQTGGWRSPR